MAGFSMRAGLHGLLLVLLLMPGLAAASKGHQVILSDLDPDALEFARAANARQDTPGPDWAQHLARVEWAPIATIHSFCASLLREFGAALELDPGFAVLEATEFDELRQEVLEGLARARLKAHDPQLARLLGVWRLGGRLGLYQRLSELQAGLATMGFGEHYINVFTVLKNIGMLSEQPVRTAEGQEVIPLKVLKAVLPDPASLAPSYTGKTCIGDMVAGEKDGKPRKVFIYNVSDHEDSYREIGSQAISYTAGVPAAAAALLIADGRWDVKQMANIEQLPPRPWLELMAEMGLETWMREGGRDLPIATGAG